MWLASYAQPSYPVVFVLSRCLSMCPYEIYICTIHTWYPVTQSHATQTAQLHKKWQDWLQSKVPCSIYTSLWIFACILNSMLRACWCIMHYAYDNALCVIQTDLDWTYKGLSCQTPRTELTVRLDSQLIRLPYFLLRVGSAVAFCVAQ